MRQISIAAGLLLGVSSILFAADEPVDRFMGDWQGKVKIAKGGKTSIVAQVIPQGKGSYLVNILPQFDARVPAIAVLEGNVTNDTLVLAQKGGNQPAAWSGVVAGGKFTGNSAEGQDCTFAMKKVVRLSPTMGAKPPKKNGTILLGKETTDLATDWQREKGGPCAWKLLPGGTMQVVPRSGSLMSKKEFGNQRVHVEFRYPYEPENRGQDRGNSGVYLQGRYEVQVLDSYGLEGMDNECGGIYRIARPRVNMAAPPLQWQTYDITFWAPVMDGDKVVKLPRMTVLHNGVKIHENLEIPRGTVGTIAKNALPTGVLLLQDHSHPVEYRNIWIEELP